MVQSDEQRLWTRDYFLAFVALVGAQLVFITLMTYMALYAVEQFQATDTGAGFAASSFVLGAALSRLAIGKYLDFIGRKRILLVALALYVVCSLLYPLVDQYSLLIVIRLVQGSGFGVISTTVATAVIDLIPAARLSEGLGYISLAGTLSNAVGPLASIQLSQNASSVWVFGFATLCALIALLAVLPMHIRERKPTQDEYDRRWRIRGSDLLDSNMLPVAIVALIASVGFAMVMTFLTPYLVSQNMADVASLFFLVWALAMLGVRLFAGRLHDRHGDNAVIPAALCSLALGLAVVAVADNAWHFVIAAILGGMGHGGVVPSLQAVGIRRTTTNRIPVATSTHYLALDSGIAIGPVALGFMIGVAGYPGLYLAAAGIVLFGIAVYWLAHGRHVAPGPR